MNEIVRYRNLYNELYNALENAAAEESGLLQSALNHHFSNEDKHKHDVLNTVAIVELREYMQQLIQLLNIELSKSLQGKRINAFNDAVAIVSDCRIQIITKMERHSDDAAYTAVIKNIINCCEEVSSIREF